VTILFGFVELFAKFSLHLFLVCACMNLELTIFSLPIDDSLMLPFIVQSIGVFCDDGRCQVEVSYRRRRRRQLEGLVLAHF
jgi:hypothetical protein